MVLQGVDSAPPAGSPSRFTRMIVHMTRGRHFYFHVAHCNRPITDLEIKTHYMLWLQTCGDAYSMIVWLYTPTYILRLEFLNKTYSPFHIDQRIPEFSDLVPWTWRKALKIMPHTGKLRLRSHATAAQSRALAVWSPPFLFQELNI